VNVHTGREDDPVSSGAVKEMSLAQLLRLNGVALAAGFSGRRSDDWIRTHIRENDRLIVRPLLWEDSPSHSIRCSVVFMDKDHGLGQILIDIAKQDFDVLVPIADDQLRQLSLYLIDRVKVIPPS
jgi:hypothetical protein